MQSLPSKMAERLVSPSSLWTVHSAISITTIALSAVYLLLFDALTEIGDLWKSPTIPLLIASELIKWFVNVKWFKLVGRPKHIPVAANQRHEAQFINRIKYALSIIITLAIFFCVYAFTCIIFGAAIVEHLPGTISLSLVLVTLTVLPVVLYVGGRATWELLFCDEFQLSSKSQTAYLEYIQSNAVVCLFGAWISSVVVPLDWDRDWQAYPIPNVCGAVMGMAVSNGFWLLLGIGSRFRTIEKLLIRQKTN